MQRSYITEKTIALMALGEQHMTIATFGATRSDKRVCKYVRVGLKVKYGQVWVLILLSVLKICEPLTAHPLADSKEIYPHLSGLKLADDSGDAQKLKC